MNPFLRIGLRVAIILFAVWYAVGLVLLATPWMPTDLVEESRVWGDVVFLLLAAAVTYLYSAKICGGRMAALISAIVLVVSAGAELFGAKTGYPFGHYEYTENLGPKLLGLMPLIIPFCWLTIVLNAFWIVSFLFQRFLADPSAKLMMFITGALLAVLTDFNLEPVASLVKLYWIWYDAGSGYLGISSLNFFGWWMVSFVIFNIIYSQLPEELQVTEVPWTSYGILAAINVLFALINLRAGFLLPVFVAVNTFGALGILLFLRDPKSRP